MVAHCYHPARCCGGPHIYRRRFISPAVSAAHRGNTTQTKSKTSLHECLHFHLYLSEMSFCVHSSILSNNSRVHIYPCFSLHPGINVLHYPNNRAANYENFLFKRLFSFSKRLLTVLANLIRGNPDVLVRKPGFF